MRGELEMIENYNIAFCYKMVFNFSCEHIVLSFVFCKVYNKQDLKSDYRHLLNKCSMKI